MHMCMRCNGVYVTCGWLRDVSWPQVSNVSTENKHLSWNIILVNKHAFLENHKIMRLIFLKINNHFFLERLFYGMRLKCLPCLMNSLLASGKIKEQFPKKSVGWLSTNSQLKKQPTGGHQMVNCGSRVGKLLFYSLPTVGWQILWGAVLQFYQSSTLSLSYWQASPWQPYIEFVK